MRWHVASSPTDTRMNPSAMPNRRRSSASIPAREVVAGNDSHISTPPKLGADTEICRKRGPALDARWNPNDPTRPPDLA